MTASLRDRAAVANGTRPTDPAPATPPAAGTDLPDIEYTGAITDAEQVPVHVAWARVMADVQAVGKGDRRDDSGGRYNFRGVDRIVNAVGPALRRHGVLVLPIRVHEIERRETRTTTGKAMEDCTLIVDWIVVGPMGDQLPGPLQSAGQANDTGEKATAKAVSVAQRVLFLTALHIPTQDPTIDQGHDRGEQPRPDANAYRDEILEPRTSLGRLRQMVGEISRHGLNGVLVVNDIGDDEALGDLIRRVGLARQEGQS